MKNIGITFLIVFIILLPFETIEAKETTAIKNPNYDAKLAQELGADDYGMKPFVLVMLKQGKNTNPDTELKNKAFTGHMKNINRLVELKKLLVAGPFGKNKQGYRGLFILNVKTLVAAKELLATDPAIKAEYLDADLIVWYGSAALSEYLPVSDKIWKINP